MVGIAPPAMTLKGYWQLPASRAVVDSDWGDTPTLFTDGFGHRRVAAVNKDGFLYAFDRARVEAGPVWNQAIAVGGICPTCGDGSVASGAFDGAQLYFAGGNT